MPEVVLREVESQHLERLSKAAIEAQRSVKNLRELLPPHIGFSEADRLLTRGVVQITEELHSRIHSWLQEAKVTQLRVAPSHGNRIIDKYFSGQAPFKEAKHRDDFPDAFIWETVADLSESTPLIHFISNDPGFEPAVVQLGGKVKLYKDFQAFFKAGVLSFTVTEDDRRIARTLRTQVDNLYDQVKEVIHSSLKAYSLPVPPEFPEEGASSPFEIERVLALKAVTLDAGSISTVGNLTYILPFSSDVTMRASYQSRAGWQEGTFNLSKSARIRGDYNARLNGSVIVRFSAGESAAAEIELGKLTLADCRLVTETGGAADSGPVGIRAGPDLQAGVDNCQGFVLIVGKHRIRRLRAASTLLNNLAAAHPDSFFVSAHGHFDAPSVGTVRPIRRDDFETSELFVKKLQGLWPSGISLDLNHPWDFDAAIALAQRNIAVIAVAEAHTEDDINDKLYRFWSSPIIVTAI